MFKKNIYSREDSSSSDEDSDSDSDSERVFFMETEPWKPWKWWIILWIRWSGSWGRTNQCFEWAKKGKEEKQVPQGRIDQAKGRF